MPRPKSDDPKVAVTIRLPRSVVAHYEAMGGGWRAKMEAVILADGPIRIGDRLLTDCGEPEVVTAAPLRMPRAGYGARLKKR